MFAHTGRWASVFAFGMALTSLFSVDKAVKKGSLRTCTLVQYMQYISDEVEMLKSQHHVCFVPGGVLQ